MNGNIVAYSHIEGIDIFVLTKLNYFDLKTASALFDTMFFFIIGRNSLFMLIHFLMSHAHRLFFSN